MNFNNMLRIIFLLLVFYYSNSLNYLNYPNNKDDLPPINIEDFTNNYEVDFHYNKIKEIQHLSKETVCMVLLKNMLTNPETQRLFMTVLKHLIYENNKESDFFVDMDKGYDMLNQILFEKCMYVLHPKYIIPNLAPNEIFYFNEEEIMLIKDILESSKTVRFYKKFGINEKLNEMKSDL